MPSHFSDPKLRIVSASACVGTHIPHAVGIALASKLRELDEVTATFFGDGATSTGDWHESMNFAGIHKLPVIFVCEHNGYAISVPWRKQAAVESVASRAEGYGFPGVSVDGNDVLAVYQVAREAMSRARDGEGPTLIEARTYRLVPHTSDDDDRRYRSREEVEEWKKKDPLIRFSAWIEEHGIADRSDLEAIQAEVARDVDEASEYAEQAPVAEPESALRHVYVDEEEAV
jgi:2-oxoisovalerate dehydrogenase E1 component alpha subunit